MRTRATPSSATVAGPKRAVEDQLGRPLRDLRVSVTDRCNFRCPYCMPAENHGEQYHFLPKAEVLSYEEIARLARLFVSLGTSKIRLTGGEPLVRQGIEHLVALLADIKGVEDLALTTNGYFLAQQAQALKDAGLQRVTVSLDTLDDAIFRKMNGRDYGIESILEGIRKAGEVGFHPIKLNTVVQRGVNDHTVVDLARFFKGIGHIVRFIEYMDAGNRNSWEPDHVVPSREIIRRISEEMPLEPVEKNYRGEVADQWRYVDGSGEIGVISSVTEPFCGDCTRVRLSPDGKMYTCLFASLGHDLKTPLRAGATDKELENLIQSIWRMRSDRYSEERATLGEPRHRKVEMYRIGG